MGFDGTYDEPSSAVEYTRRGATFILFPDEHPIQASQNKHHLLLPKPFGGIEEAYPNGDLSREDSGPEDLDEDMQAATDFRITKKNVELAVLERQSSKGADLAKKNAKLRELERGVSRSKVEGPDTEQGSANAENHEIELGDDTVMGGY